MQHSCLLPMQGPLLQPVVTLPAPAAGASTALTFNQGLASNTDYIVRLIARDAAGNCRRAVARIPVHTADNIPPVTLTLAADNITGDSAVLLLELDEPGTALIVVQPSAATNGSCPSTADMFAIGSDLNGPEAAAAGPITGSVNTTVPAGSPAVTRTPITGLDSETAYTACVVAQDATQLHNRQTSVASVSFRTLDVTPPVMQVHIKPGADGDITCAHAPPYTCNVTWNSTLSEAGDARWVLLQNATGVVSALPTPAALMSQALASLFPGDLAPSVVGDGELQYPQTPNGEGNDVTLTNLTSQSLYLLVASALDRATPSPNVAVALVVVPIITPDLRPPQFLDYSAESVTDTRLDLSVRLDEAGTTVYLVVPSPSTPPTVDELFQGQAAGGAAPTSFGNASCSANTTSVAPSDGLQPGTLYDLHIAAVDTAGNRQPVVTTIR